MTNSIGASLRSSLTSKIFYFDRTATDGFYPIHGCAFSCGLSYNNFQNFQDNLYWSTSGKFSSINGFHVSSTNWTSNPSSCTADPSTWALLPYSGTVSWQGSAPSGVTWTPGMNEDTGGTVTTDPGFGNTGTKKRFHHRVMYRTLPHRI